MSLAKEQTYRYSLSKCFKPCEIFSKFVIVEMVGTNLDFQGKGHQQEQP